MLMADSESLLQKERNQSSGSVGTAFLGILVHHHHIFVVASAGFGGFPQGIYVCSCV